MPTVIPGIASSFRHGSIRPGGRKTPIPMVTLSGAFLQEALGQQQEDLCPLSLSQSCRAQRPATRAQKSAGARR
jgi:hypothetical protein